MTSDHRPTADHRPQHDAPAEAEIERDVLDPTEEGVVGVSEAGRADPTADPKRPDGLTPDGRFRVGRLAGLTMGPAIWILGWPVLLESFLNSLVGLTDTWLASQLGVDEADAIGGASYVMWFIGLTFMAIGIGATALISRAIGAGRKAVAGAVLGQATLLAVTSGTLVGLLIAVAAGPLAGLLNMTEDATAAFTGYMTIIATAVPGASLLFVLIACARGAGDSVRPLQAMAVRNVVNVVVSWALSGVDIATTSEVGGEVVVRVWLENPFGFDLGILGIAIGTVAGDIAGLLVILRMALSGAWGVTLLRRRLKPHFITAWRLVRLGVPNFIETFGMWAGNFFVIMMVGWMGAGMLGTHVIAIRLEAVSFLPGFAIGSAAATLAGQYLGARRPDLAALALRRCAMIAAGIMGLIGLGFMLAPRLFVGLLSQQAAHLEHTPMLLVICGAIQIPFALGIVLRSGMRGAGDVRFVMVITWVTTYAVRLPLAWLLSGVDIVHDTDVDGEIVRRVLLENPMPDDFPIRGLWGLWIALCADQVIRAAVYGARFLHGGWSRHRI